MRGMTAGTLAVLLAACNSKENARPFKAPMKLAGKMVPAATLNAGSDGVHPVLPLLPR